MRASIEALGSAASSAADSGGAATDSLDGILTPHDECERWRRLASGGGASRLSPEEQRRGPKEAAGHVREYHALGRIVRRAEDYWAALEPVASRLKEISSLTPSRAR